jgi:molybdenum cofactor synthesis domain-containing protein
MTQAQATIVTAAALVIGDEILSGRTKDKNIGTIADFCTAIGLDLREVRVVPDVTEEIVAAVNALRSRYDYVFTTGGIGPTHDDITADAIAAAFEVEISEDPRAIELLMQQIKREDLNEARRRMARIPHGADLVLNRISKAPGFWIGNVIVMAGVPSIMQAMLEEVGPRLSPGALTVAETIEVGNLPEGAYAAELAAVALSNPYLSIGSYPSMVDGKFRNQIVVRGKDAGLVAQAVTQIGVFVSRLHAERTE